MQRARWQDQPLRQTTLLPGCHSHAQTDVLSAKLWQHSHLKTHLKTSETAKELNWMNWISPNQDTPTLNKQSLYLLHSLYWHIYLCGTCPLLVLGLTNIQKIFYQLTASFVSIDEEIHGSSELIKGGVSWKAQAARGRGLCEQSRVCTLTISHWHVALLILAEFERAAADFGAFWHVQAFYRTRS